MFTSIINLHNNLVMFVGSKCSLFFNFAYGKTEKERLIPKKNKLKSKCRSPKCKSQVLRKKKKDYFKGTKINKSRWGSVRVKTGFLQDYNIRHLTV